MSNADLNFMTSVQKMYQDIMRMVSLENNKAFLAFSHYLYKSHSCKSYWIINL